jgi:protein O-mannosyl-transferase
MPLRSWTKILILCSAVIVVYINSFSGVFQFDDYRMVLNYARAHSFESWLYYFPHNIRPVLKASFTLNWLSGSGLFGFHLFNLATHITNTLLVYFISLKFLSADEYTHLKNAAFLAALLFGLHPIQTEAVTYVCGRSVSLMSMFYLGSMLAYIIGTEKNKSILTQVLSSLFFILAVLTRETALTLPAALFLWDLFRRPEDGFGKILRRQSIHWIICILILGAVVFNVKYEQLLSFSYDLRGIMDNLLSQFNGLAYLLSRLVAVNGLNIDPDIPAFTAWTPVLIVKAALILSMLALSIISLKKNRWVSFGILWFFLHILPTNSIIPRLDIANERHMYLPVWGLFLVVAIGIEKLRVAFTKPAKNEIRCQRSEIGGRKSEVRDRRSEICLALPRCHSERSEESRAIKEQLGRLPVTSMISPSEGTMGDCLPLDGRSTLSPSGGGAGEGPKAKTLTSSPYPLQRGTNKLCIKSKGLMLTHACVILLLLVLGFFTWSRNNVYRSEVALWEDTVRKSPKRARCYNNLGFAYELEERYHEARKAYADAWNLDNDYEFAKNNLERIDAILKGSNP